MAMPVETPFNFLHGLADGWQRVRGRFSIWVSAVLGAGLWRIGPPDSDTKVAAITILVLAAMLVVLRAKRLGIDKDEWETIQRQSRATHNASAELV
jgi:hypothetical protein